MTIGRAGADNRQGGDRGTGGNLAGTMTSVLSATHQLGDAAAGTLGTFNIGINTYHCNLKLWK